MLTHRVRLGIALVAAGLLAGTSAGVTAAGDSDDDDVVAAKLSGFQEDPLALSTTGSGRFRATIDDRRQEIRYRLTYSALEGTVAQAHIHIGGRHQSGGISVFLCTNLGNGPAGTQLCPAAPATVTGTLRPADVIGPAGQGITAGQFNELVAAIEADTAYVNVHSSMYPAGEIRAQLDHQHHHD
jgi:CHRD domain